MNKFLSKLSNLKGLKKPSRRVGRGYGSTSGGHTATRGMKGQKSRSGGKLPIWFEGGQTPLIHRMPYKRGFINHNAPTIVSVNLSSIIKIVKNTTVVTPDTLIKAGLAENRKFDGIKILGKGSVEKKMKFSGFTYSKRAKDKIESVGGKAE